jgi:hypothetical protein
LVEAFPLGGQAIAPDVVGVPGKRAADGGDRAQVIAKDSARGGFEEPLLTEGEPGGGRQLGQSRNSMTLRQPGFGTGDRHPVFDGAG